MVGILATDASANPVFNRLADAELQQWQFPQHDYRQYASQAVRELGQPLIHASPEDITDYCPRYPVLSPPLRRAFWSELLAFMAKSESNHSPSGRYQENFNDRAGKPVISRGLLQISYESAQAYGCELETAQSLHNPRQNLRCAVRILNRWIGGDNRLAGRAEGAQWLGGARYWRALRDNEQHRQIRQAAQSLPYCQTPVQRSAPVRHDLQRIARPKVKTPPQRLRLTPPQPSRVSARAPVPRRYLRAERPENPAVDIATVSLTRISPHASISATSRIRPKPHDRPRRYRQSENSDPGYRHK